MTNQHETIAARILVVDDDHDIRHLLVSLLGKKGYEVLQAPSGDDALDLLAQRSDVDLVLLDLNMPGIDGYEVLRRLKTTALVPEVPVIFVSAQGEADDKVVGLELGAVDYVVKPFNREELLARVAGALRAKATLDRLRQSTVEFERLAVTDELTGLSNRRSFEERLAHELARAQRDAAPLSCLMLDIDHFKSVNDRFGHPVGDVVLREVARALRAGVRSFDTVARYGGEEFAVLLPGARLDGAYSVAEALRQTVAALRIRVEDQPAPLAVTISIGLACFDGRTGAPLAPIQSADEALYAAKRAGRNRIMVAE